MAEIRLKNVRLAFPSIFEPKAFDEKSKAKYQATFLVPKNSPLVAEIEKVIRAAAVAKWGPKADAILASIRGNNQKYCFLDGDVKSDYDGFEGNWYVNAKSLQRPFVCDLDKTPLTQEDGKPYGGCYVVAKVEIYAQDTKNGKGIRADLKGVQFYRDGDAFAGGVPATADDFDDLSNTGEEEEALA